MNKKYLIIAFFFFSMNLFADCVYDAKDKSSYKVLETGYGAKIYFSGGWGGDFVITLDGSLYSTYISDIYFIKDSFCDYEDDVLVIDDEVFGVTSVTIVD
jgi:hypothetical protein